MKRLLILLIALFIPSACAGDASALFEEYLWQNRLVLVFTPDEKRAPYITQMQYFKNQESAFAERDIILWQFNNLESVQKNGKYLVHLSTNPFYKEMKVDDQEFAVILIGKDGEEKLRRATPIEAKNLFEIIDAMPMRQDEMK